MLENEVIYVLNYVYETNLKCYKLMTLYTYHEVLYFRLFTSYKWGTWWRSWLRHCVTSWKVMGLIPDGVVEIFH